ncbi:ATP-dependent nuclease [Nocardioides sp. WG-D5]
MGDPLYLCRLRLRNFQSFGSTPITVELDKKTTFLLGANGSGKTSAMVALARMFAADPALRRVQLSDFHVSLDGTRSDDLWIEADFVAAPPHTPQASDDGAQPADAGDGADGESEMNGATVPAFFDDMRLFDEEDDHPRVRIRLTARIDEAEEVEEHLDYVTEIDKADEPVGTSRVSTYDRRSVQVHYLPARRDPRQHLEHSANNLLGRLLRSIDWEDDRETIADLSQKVSDAIGSNDVMSTLAGELDAVWKTVHSGTYFQSPAIAFAAADLTALLRHLTVAFAPAPGKQRVEWTRLSDGEQSAFYLALVLALHAIGKEAIINGIDGVDAERLRAPSYTILAVEEPENSLSPHHLGRIMRRLDKFAADSTAQILMSSHSPAVVHRTSPDSIRHLRLDDARTTRVSAVALPETSDEAYKFVTQAVQAYPELYFARLVILGEGDSERAVLPRLIEAHDLEADTSGISVVPLGGRHVNHFWRLLDGLQIPYITLLDMDLGRYGGGWGRVRTALMYLQQFPGTSGLKPPSTEQIEKVPAWDDVERFRDHALRDKVTTYMEKANIFFSYPLDLDYAMIRAFPTAYKLADGDLEEPDNNVLASVLGKSVIEQGEPVAARVAQYTDEERTYFATYHELFKLGSKPVKHLEALTTISDANLREHAPTSLRRLAEAATARLKELPE